MNEKEYILIYDEGDDSLSFMTASTPADHTINTGLVLLHVTEQQQIVGFELMGVHEKFGIPHEVLRHLARAQVSFNHLENIHKLIINIDLYFQDNKSLILVTDLQVNEHLMESPQFTAIASS